jgi:hypothetical protein
LILFLVEVNIICLFTFQIIKETKTMTPLIHHIQSYVEANPSKFDREVCHQLLSFLDLDSSKMKLEERREFFETIRKVNNYFKECFLGMQQLPSDYEAGLKVLDKLLLPGGIEHISVEQFIEYHKDTKENVLKVLLASPEFLTAEVKITIMQSLVEKNLSKVGPELGQPYLRMLSYLAKEASKMKPEERRGFIESLSETYNYYVKQEFKGKQLPSDYKAGLEAIDKLLRPGGIESMSIDEFIEFHTARKEDVAKGLPSSSGE